MLLKLKNNKSENALLLLVGLRYRGAGDLPQLQMWAPGPSELQMWTFGMSEAGRRPGPCLGELFYWIFPF